jgi:hypothetical protein
LPSRLKMSRVVCSTLTPWLAAYSSASSRERMFHSRQGAITRMWGAKAP